MRTQREWLIERQVAVDDRRCRPHCENPGVHPGPPSDTGFPPGLSFT